MDAKISILWAKIQKERMISIGKKSLGALVERTKLIVWIVVPPKDGMFPENMLECKSKTSKFPNVVMAGGMGPFI